MTLADKTLLVADCAKRSGGSIGTLNEGPLHAGLKRWYARAGDATEVPVDGREVDIVRGDLLIEIQTGGFSPLKRKLAALVEEHPVRLVHPIPREKWIVRLDDEGAVMGRRKSPTRGRVEDAFAELVSLSGLLGHPNFSFEVLLTQEEEVRQHAPGRVWRRKGWVIQERRLLDVVERRTFADARAYQSVLPAELPREFTTADLSRALGASRDLAQKIGYALRKAGFVETRGKRGNALVYLNPWRDDSTAAAR